MSTPKVNTKMACKAKGISPSDKLTNTAMDAKKITPKSGLGGFFKPAEKDATAKQFNWFEQVQNSKLKKARDKLEAAIPKDGRVSIDSFVEEVCRVYSVASVPQ